MPTPEGIAKCHQLIDEAEEHVRQVGKICEELDIVGGTSPQTMALVRDLLRSLEGDRPSKR
jgi:hypothetical protein